SMNASGVLLRVTALSTIVVLSGCGGWRPPMSPTPVGDPPTANVYILPGAVGLGKNAFGDETIVIFKGERMRWQNLDSVAHTLVPDTPSLPEFETTGPLAPGNERSFVMMTTGSTKIHCTEHTQMIRTLVFRER